MKQFKRLGLTLITAITLIICFACFACDVSPVQKTGYFVTLSFDKSKGLVTATDYSEGKKYDEGTTITVTVTPEEGFEVNTFSVTGQTDAALDENGSFTFEITADTTVTVTFKEKQVTPPASDTYSLTLNYDDTMGTVIATAATNGNNTYVKGTAVTVTVTPEEGYEIDAFSVTGQTDATLDEKGSFTFEITADTTVTVTFKESEKQTVYYTLTLNYDDDMGSVTATDFEKGKQYPEGAEITVTVEPEREYKISSFAITGYENAQLDNDKFTFEIHGNTVVDVAFVAREHYSVTVIGADSHGSYSISPNPESDGNYLEGEEITLTVQPENGYKVAAFETDNNDNAKLSEGKYTFTITENTVITLSFVEDKFGSKLEEIQGSVKFEGHIDYSYSDNTSVSWDIAVVYDAAQNAIWQYESREGILSYSIIYVKDDNGKLAAATHNESGALVKTAISLQDGTTPDFEEFSNPFASLTSDDFIADGDNTYVLNSQKKDNILYVMTGYTYEVETVEFFEENGHLSRMTITSALLYASVTYTVSVTFNVTTENVEINPDWLKDYELTAEHTPLVNALSEMSIATNYTVERRSEEVALGKMYVTEDAIYTRQATNKDERIIDFGYTTLDDWGEPTNADNGTVNYFEYDTENNLFYYQPTDVTSLTDLKATFSPNASFFQTDDANVYKLRVPEKILGSQPLAGLTAICFACGIEQISRFASAIDCTVTLQNETLYSVEVTYFYQDGNSNYILTETLVYSDVGSTTLPTELQASDLNNIPADYWGTYESFLPWAWTGELYVLYISPYELTLSITDMTVTPSSVNSYVCTDVIYNDYNDTVEFSANGNSFLFGFGSYDSNTYGVAIYGLEINGGLSWFDRIYLTLDVPGAYFEDETHPWTVASTAPDVFYGTYLLPPLFRDPFTDESSFIIEIDAYGVTFTMDGDSAQAVVKGYYITHNQNGSYYFLYLELDGYDYIIQIGVISGRPAILILSDYNGQKVMDFIPAY